MSVNRSLLSPAAVQYLDNVIADEGGPGRLDALVELVRELARQGWKPAETTKVLVTTAENQLAIDRIPDDDEFRASATAFFSEVASLVADPAAPDASQAA